MFKNLDSLNPLQSLSPESSSRFLNPPAIYSFFKRVKDLKESIQSQGWATCPPAQNPKLIIQMFFESSSRTRMSFEIAAHRLGHSFIHYQMDESTSHSKGESVKDSLKLASSYGADVVIYRVSEAECVKTLKEENGTCKFICAGAGTLYHPTQALLDTYTLYEYLRSHKRSLDSPSTGLLEGLKIVFIGDVLNSRVFYSHWELSQVLGYSVGQCTASFREVPGTSRFHDLEEAALWADVIVRLRDQKERGASLSPSQYILKSHVLDDNPLKLLMHPGPFLRGEDLEFNLPEHKQSLIWKQKENGLYVRLALLKSLWEEDVL